MQGSQKRRFTRCSTTENVWSVLYGQWFNTPLGKEIFKLETACMNEQMSNLFGYHLLMLGSPRHIEGIKGSRVSHRTVMDITGEHTTAGEGQFCGHPEMLPVNSDTLDVVVLPHILEFSESPHNVLREVDRVLVAEGHVIILGFNPLGSWSIWRWLFGWRKQLPWCGTFISTTRAKDWLALLGFEPIETQYFFHRPPLQYKGILKRLAFLDNIAAKLLPWLSGGYVLLARKKVSTMTPIKPRWRTRQKIHAGLTEPLSRAHNSLKIK